MMSNVIVHIYPFTSTFFAGPFDEECIINIITPILSSFTSSRERLHSPSSMVDLQVVFAKITLVILADLLPLHPVFLCV